MATDPYSPCLCGSGKKAKFCCADVQVEVRQIEEMIAGEQYLAALKRLEEIEGKSPPRARFSVLKLGLLRQLDRAEQWKTAAADFRRCFPDNPIALAESAELLAIEGDPVGAVGELQRSLAASEPLTIYPQMYDAMGTIGRALLESGDFRAARALLELQLQIGRDDPDVVRVLHALNTSPAVPLLLKQDLAAADGPADAPWKTEFDQAMAHASKLRWADAAAALAALAQRVDDSAAVWRELATLRGLLADRSGTVDALCKLSRLEIPLEDGVEARATAMLLEEDPLGDGADSLWFSFPVRDADHLGALLSTWKHAVATDRDEVAVGEDDVPPKAVFWLLDRPANDTPEALAVETMPGILGRAMLFGRQTDRQARLELAGVPGGDVQTLRAMLAEVGGEELVDDPEQEVLGRRSASRCLFERRWRLPPGVTRKQLTAFRAEYLDRAVLETWPRMPLGLFEGKTPEEVAGDPAHRVPLLAAIMLLEAWLGQAGERFDLNRLRSQLGLPTLEPIELGDDSVLDVPLVRLARVKVDDLPDETLAHGFTLAATYGIVEALRTFGRCWIDRPGIDARGLHHVLRVLAANAEDEDRRLEYIARGRQTAETLGESSASWDLMEINSRLARGEPDEVERLLRHVEREHIREPGVAEAFAGILMRLGILRPDGTLVESSPEEEAPDASAEPGGLWTPDSVAPKGEKPKLWTPGMD